MATWAGKWGAGIAGVVSRLATAASNYFDPTYSVVTFSVLPVKRVAAHRLRRETGLAGWGKNGHAAEVLLQLDDDTSEHETESAPRPPNFKPLP